MNQRIESEQFSLKPQRMPRVVRRAIAMAWMLGLMLAMAAPVQAAVQWVSLGANTEATLALAKAQGWHEAPITIQVEVDQHPLPALIDWWRIEAEGRARDLRLIQAGRAVELHYRPGDWRPTLAQSGSKSALDHWLIEVESALLERARLQALADQLAALKLDAATRRVAEWRWLLAVERSRLGGLVLDWQAPVSIEDRAGALGHGLYVRLLFQRGQTARAAAALEVLSAWITAQAAEDVELGIELKQLRALQALRAGEHPAALALAEEVVAMAREQDGPSLRTAIALRRLAEVLEAGDRRADALVQLELAVEMQRAIAPEDPVVLLSMINCASVLRRLGRFDESDDWLSRSEQLAQRLQTPLLTQAHLALLRGNAEVQKWRLSSAQAHYERSLELLGPDARQLGGGAVSNLAMIAFERGDLQRSSHLWRDAMALQAALRPGSLEEARTLINAARTAHHSGDLDAAGEHYAKAAAILARISPDVPLSSYLHANWAELEADRGELDSAGRKFQEALRVNALQPADCYCSGPTLRDYAVFLGETGRSKEALTQLAEARAVLDRFDNGRVEGWSMDVQEAGLRLQSGQTQAAEALIAPAAAHLLKQLPGSPLTAQALYTKGLVAAEAGDAQTAREAFCQAADVLDQVDLARSPDGLLAARFRAHYAEVYRACLSSTVGIGDAAAVFAEFERVRARSLALKLQQRRVEIASEAPALAKWTRFLEGLASLQAEIQSPETALEQVQAAAQALLDQRARFAAEHAALRQAAPRSASWLAPRLLQLEAAQAALPEGSLYLAFSVGEQDTLVLSLDRQGSAITRLPHGRAHWQAAVESLRTRILARRSADLDAIRELGAALRQSLFVELAPQLGRARELLIAADGPLLQLPFAALWDGASQRYLVQSHALQMVDSLNLYLDARAASDAPGPWLVVADADAEAGPGQQATRNPARMALPQARLEAALVAEQARERSALLLLGDTATESRVKHEATQAGLLHFAVHGAIDDERALDSALLLNPDQGEDGELQVWEILEQLQLRAQLVVLSSCNSAIGEELRGEGLLSLTRAFRYAGARQVVATLWPVADGGSMRLMQRFYAAEPLRVRAAQALQRAVLAQLDSAETLAADPERGVGGLASPAALLSETHPYYWAGFQAY